MNLSQDKAYDFAIEVMAGAAISADAQEGIDAFLNKRPAIFTEQPKRD
jgi:hypothetical protein